VERIPDYHLPKPLNGAECCSPTLNLGTRVKITIHTNLISPVVLYGREMWSLKLEEEHRLCMRTGY